MEELDISVSFIDEQIRCWRKKLVEAKLKNNQAEILEALCYINAYETIRSHCGYDLLPPSDNK